MNGDNFLPSKGASSSQPSGAKTIDRIIPAARLLSPGVAATDGQASRIGASPSCGGVTPVTGDRATGNGANVGLVRAGAAGSECGAAVTPVGCCSCSMFVGTPVSETRRP